MNLTEHPTHPGCMGSSIVLHTAYSNLGLAPANSAEHFRLVGQMGFHAVKGDVRITSDNGLIMCHDPGFTMDENGRITFFDRQNCVPILEHSFDYWMEKEYVRQHEALGHYARVCSFEDYIRICRDSDKLAYITLREDRIPELVSGVMQTVKKYRMEHRCIVNSFGYQTLLEARKHSSALPLSHVMPKNAPLDRQTVERAAGLGNVIITLFHYPSDDPDSLWEQSAKGLTLARERGIPIHMAQVSQSSDYFSLLRRGVQGFQLRCPVPDQPPT